MYTEDTELRIKCLEIATTISGSTSDTHYFLMDSKRIYDFVLGKSDVVIDAALEEIRKFRENS